MSILKKSTTKYSSDSLDEGVLFSCRELVTGYEGAPICGGISLDIRRGDYVCIIGSNGAGKSTFVKTLLSLIPPVGGSLTLSQEVRQNGIGYLPQQSEAQKDFPAKVEEVVLSGCVASRGFGLFMGRRQRLEATQNMKIMGIEHLADKSYRCLSGGQQQKVLLARALCTQSRVLLLDEPVAGLDPDASADLYKLIRHLSSHLGVTVITVTHDLDNGLADASHVLHMGEVPQYMTIEEYRACHASGGGEM